MKIELFADYRSPYSYLTNFRLRRAKVDFSVKLIDAVEVMAAVNNQPSPACPPKARYAAMDAARSALQVAAPYAPNRPLLAAVMGGSFPGSALLRTGLAAQRLGAFREFNDAVFQALWAGDDDVTTAAGQQVFLCKSGIDLPTLWKEGALEWTSDELRNNNSEAIQKGVFGVPTTFCDSEMFFGNDRLGLIFERLQIEELA
jgi:2-hydroxychromene-2-carboxylate isomerase